VSRCPRYWNCWWYHRGPRSGPASTAPRQPTPSHPTADPTRSTDGGLTQGNSWHDSVTEPCHGPAGTASRRTAFPCREALAVATLP
jgi:hypothetical protein